MRAAAMAALLGPLVAACADGGPLGAYFIPPGAAARGTESVQVSLCYNNAVDSRESLLAKVAQDCTEPALRADGVDLDRCSVLLPRRAVYSCAKVSDRLAGERPPMDQTYLGK